MRDAADDAVPGEAGLLKCWIALQERVDEDDAVAGLQAKAGMAVPGDLHAGNAPPWRPLHRPASDWPRGLAATRSIKRGIATTKTMIGP